MKKIVASVGLVALGASSACAAYAPGLSAMDTGKAWSVAASLRGFYDDNYAYARGGPTKRDSFGVEVSPSLRLNFPLDQTYAGLRYIYSMRYYEDRKDDSADHTHQVDAILTHSFSERYVLDLQNSFVLAQEPELLAPITGPFPVLMRTEGDNIRNQARATFHAELTRLLGLVVGYNNTLWDYEDDKGTISVPSRSALLDRLEHLALLNLRWQALRETTAVLGYNFGVVDYSSSEPVAWLNPPFGPVVTSKIRDNRSHYVYGGVDHSFLKNLTGAVRLGAQFVDYKYDFANDDTVTPYADVSLSYSYATGSYAQIGFTHSRNQTDIIDPGATGKTVTSDQESSVVYGLINHRITPKLVANIQGRYQSSSFHGGRYDSGTEDFYMIGLNLTYHINQHLSAEVGYNYDNVDSDVGRNYDRNRVYLGVTASY